MDFQVFVFPFYICICIFQKHYYIIHISQHFIYNDRSGRLPVSYNVRHSPSQKGFSGPHVHSPAVEKPFLEYRHTPARAQHALRSLSLLTPQT